ncbi:MAG: NAD(P)H-dependent flavin oxidoreductase [Acidimicrobiales bacterium]
MQTRLTKTLGVDHPIMLAGMGGVSYSSLVAAVSEVGGFGCLGASTMGTQQMVDEMARVRSLTNKPFGVDLLTALPGDLVGQVKRIIDGGASVFAAGLGVPEQAISLCHDHGVLVVSLCGKVRHAIRAVEAGCDIVIAQGTEAGGHTGQVATLPLVPQVVDAVGRYVPVVAAGGISDGRGLAAVLALGADGAWVGTRFIATAEARTVTGYKEALLAASDDGTTITRAYSGKPMRVLRNDYTTRWDSHPEQLEPFPTQLAKSIDSSAMHLGGDESTPGIDASQECYPAGQGAGAIDDIPSAASVVETMSRDAKQVIEQLGRISADLVFT